MLQGNILVCYAAFVLLHIDNENGSFLAYTDIFVSFL